MERPAGTSQPTIFISSHVNGLGGRAVANGRIRLDPDCVQLVLAEALKHDGARTGRREQAVTGSRHVCVLALHPEHLVAQDVAVLLSDGRRQPCNGERARVTSHGPHIAGRSSRN